MEDSLQEEIQKLKDFLKPTLGQPINLNKAMNISILNALWAILVGEKLELTDPKLNKTINLLNNFLRSAEGPTSAAANMIPFPSLLSWPFFKKFLGVDVLENVFKRIVDLVQPALEHHKDTYDEDNIRDFMDLYLSEIHKTTDPKSSFYK